MVPVIVFSARFCPPGSDDSHPFVVDGWVLDGSLLNKKVSEGDRTPPAAWGQLSRFIKESLAAVSPPPTPADSTDAGGSVIKEPIIDFAWRNDGTRVGALVVCLPARTPSPGQEDAAQQLSAKIRSVFPQAKEFGGGSPGSSPDVSIPSAEAVWVRLCAKRAFSQDFEGFPRMPDDVAAAARRVLGGTSLNVDSEDLGRRLQERRTQPSGSELAAGKRPRLG